MSELTVEKAWQWVASLQTQLTTKLRNTDQSIQPPVKRASTEDNRFVFLEGEVLMFGNVTKSSVIALMNDIGMSPAAYTIITEGPPIYFTDKASSDLETFYPTFLQQADLPYGFAGENGTFRFSSQEISNLNRSSEPQIIDDAYVYMGDNPERVKYEDISNPAKINQFCPMMYGLGWTPVGKTGALNDIHSGNYANVSLQSDGLIDRRYFVNQNDFIRDFNDFGNRQVDCNIVGGLGSNNYNPGKYIGWRWNFNGATVNTDSIPSHIFTMPPNQLSQFDINPGAQQQYLGAEGVYPTILVELNEDVNVIF